MTVLTAVGSWLPNPNNRYYRPCKKFNTFRLDLPLPETKAKFALSDRFSISGRMVVSQCRRR